ncbi:SDR family NAD(P)-dependent oxidoreductase [Elongatibacter sediminis]|uniref:SDR family NAD(P)-dependent oxidoreductase n=1 Tax=Elongatibacter sediminis TaxID=3119006 RepID=A0AAW9RCK2_9GAMM
MTKTVLITGSTDGIGLETAKMLAGSGHTLLVHGRSAAKLEQTEKTLTAIHGAALIETYRADLSRISNVEALATAVAKRHSKLDVLINNAGVYKTPNPRTPEGYDLRFIVNTVAPFVLTKRLLPLLPREGRVINLSSAAQQPVDLDALAGRTALDDSQAYAQSKLALTMWTFHLARTLADTGPAAIAVNPASLLATKMVKDAFGTEGNDLRVGADILVRAATSDEFADASGRYFDNDQRRFALPHPDALDAGKNQRLVQAIEAMLAEIDV